MEIRMRTKEIDGIRYRGSLVPNVRMVCSICGTKANGILLRVDRPQKKRSHKCYDCLMRELVDKMNHPEVKEEPKVEENIEIQEEIKEESEAKKRRRRRRQIVKESKNDS